MISENIRKHKKKGDDIYSFMQIWNTAYKIMTTLE